VPYPVTLNNPDVRPLGDAYFNDITRGYKQKAAYLSVDADLIPEALTLTAGTRYFNTSSTEVGAIAGSFGCKLQADPPNPCIDHSVSVDLNQEGLDRTYSGFRSRANLSWKPSPDALLYYTWSQGFRAGGFNRLIETPENSPLAYVPKDWEPWQTLAHEHGGWTAPLAYAPDTLTNNELGWKTAWLDQHLQWSGALYQEDWNHAQIDAFAVQVLPGVTINGGNYRVRGLETLVRARASALTLEAGVAWNHSELVKEAPFFWADGTPINFSLLQTSATGPKLSNPAGSLGSSLAGAPTFQGNFRARYEFVLNDYRAFAQIGVVHQSESFSTTDRLAHDLQGQSIAYELPSFTTYAAALGVAKDRWQLQAYGENLTDTRAQLFANYSLGYKAVTVNRPRTLGLRLTYSFASNN
jgi:iron complex outermembrane recepter protein